MGSKAKDFAFPSAIKAVRDFYEKNGKGRKSRREVKKFILEFFGKIQKIEIT